MENYTLEEAKARTQHVRNVLSEHHFPPYAVSEAHATEYMCLESFPAQYVASGFYIMVDVGDDTHAPGRHPLKGFGRWEDPSFITLACGLHDELPPEWQERIAFWKWDEPLVWKRERQEWRKSRQASMSAIDADQQRLKTLEYGRAKRKWDKMDKAIGKYADSERPAKRQRTDDEVLQARKDERAAMNKALNSHDDDDDDI